MLCCRIRAPDQDPVSPAPDPSKEVEPRYLRGIQNKEQFLEHIWPLLHNLKKFINLSNFNS